MLKGSVFVTVVRLIREIWVFCLNVCLCTSFMPGTCRGQMRASGPLELELYTAMSCNVDTGN